MQNTKKKKKKGIGQNGTRQTKTTAHNAFAVFIYDIVAVQVCLFFIFVVFQGTVCGWFIFVFCFFLKKLLVQTMPTSGLNPNTDMNIWSSKLIQIQILASPISHLFLAARSLQNIFWLVRVLSVCSSTGCRTTAILITNRLMVPTPPFSFCVVLLCPPCFLKHCSLEAGLNIPDCRSSDRWL